MHRFTIITALVATAAIAAPQVAQAATPGAQPGQTARSAAWNHPELGDTMPARTGAPVVLASSRTLVAQTAPETAWNHPELRGAASTGSETAAVALQPSPTVIVRSVRSSGFNWADAAAGLLAGLGLALIAAVGLIARGRRRVALPS